MSNVLTIARRELAQNFQSPLAYVFLILFVLLAQVFYMLSALQNGQADLRFFFDLLPLFIVMFSALVTMRSWAEDRSANTYEMLLTFPMKDWELVVGKYLASAVFMCGAVLCTITLPLLVFSLGEPDPGPILSGYLGALLTVSMWSAVGVFFSSLGRSQLMAALITFVLGILSLALGVEFVKLLVDARAPGLGLFLSSVFGTWSHYAPFTRGVIELADIGYFLGWTAAFLYLNVLALERSRRAVTKPIAAAAAALAIGCGLLGARLFHDTTLSRADLTEEGLYTLSTGTVNILKRADAPVRATLYITARDEMPSDYKGLEQEIVDRLSEIRAATGGFLTVRVMHPRAANLVLKTEADENAPEIGGGEEGTEGETTETVAKKKREKTIERRLMEKGVQPFEVQTIETTEQSSKVIFATLGLAYREKDEEFIQPLARQTLGQLEYNIAQTVAQLVRPKAPKVALYLGPEPIEPWMAQAYQRAGRPIPDPYSHVAEFLRAQKVDVQRVKLNAHEPLPDDYDALIVIGPNAFNDRQRWELNRALVAGRPTLLAVQRYTWEYPDARGGGISLKSSTIEPGVDEVLAASGLGVSRDLLLDENHIALSFRTNDIRDLMGGKRVPFAGHIDVKGEGLSDDSVLTERLGSLLYLWGTALELDEAKLSSQLMTHQVLARSSQRSWQVPSLRTQADLKFQGPDSDDNRVALIARIEGQFQDAYVGTERPDWPFEMAQGPDGRPLPAPADSPPTDVVKRPGTLFLAGSAQMWGNGLINAFDNGALLLNVIDALTLDDDLSLVRSKEPRARRFDKPDETEALLFWLVPLAGMPLLIILLGVGIGMSRMRAREAWNAKHGR